MLNITKRLWKEESGQGMAEYGLILALVAIVVIAALTALGTGVKDRIQEVANEVKDSKAQNP